MPHPVLSSNEKEAMFVTDANDFLRVEQKWGFGMAPIKQDVQAKRSSQARVVMDCIESNLPDSESPAEALSEVKGLFTRIYKQDQWDWFTVWAQLGRPGTNRAKEISNALYDLRKSILNVENEESTALRARLVELGVLHLLNRFVNPGIVEDDSEAIGKIYILSTRENRNILKIGYTNRTVEERVKEINSATGVFIPYGVRAMWIIKSAREVESELHTLLSPFRIREDREFFQMDFKEAFKFISSYIREKRQEL
jgi:T5orf172 domain